MEKENLRVGSCGTGLYEAYITAMQELGEVPAVERYQAICSIVRSVLEQISFQHDLYLEVLCQAVAQGIVDIPAADEIFHSGGTYSLLCRDDAGRRPARIEHGMHVFNLMHEVHRVGQYGGECLSDARLFEFLIIAIGHDGKANSVAHLALRNEIAYLRETLPANSSLASWQAELEENLF